MINKSTAYIIFRFSFVIFLIANIADFHLPSSIDLVPFIHISKIPFIKIIVLILFALVLIPLKEYKNIFLNEKRSVTILILLLTLIATAYISAYLSEFSGTAFKVCNRIFFYIAILFICITARKYFEDSGSFIIKSFVYSNSIVILGSLLDFYIPQFHLILIQYFDRPEAIHSYIQIGTHKILRPMGFVTDANLSAFTINIALLLLLINHNHFNRIFRYTFYISGSFVFGMLTSRGSLIMIMVCGIIFFIFKMTQRKELLIFVLIFFVFQLITPQTYGRILSSFNKEKIEEEYTVGRPVIWNAAFNVFKENPIIGKGPGVFFELSQIYIRNILKDIPYINIDNPGSSDFHKIDKLNPHNIFLVMLTETGLIGFTIFLLLILTLFIYYYKEKNYISLILFLNILMVSALSNFAPYYKYYLLISIIFYLISNQNIKIIPTPQKTIPPV